MGTHPCHPRSLGLVQLDARETTRQRSHVRRQRPVPIPPQPVGTTRALSDKVNAGEKKGAGLVRGRRPSGGVGGCRAHLDESAHEPEQVAGGGATRPPRGVIRKGQGFSSGANGSREALQRAEEDRRVDESLFEFERERSPRARPHVRQRVVCAPQGRFQT